MTDVLMGNTSPQHRDYSPDGGHRRQGHHSTNGWAMAGSSGAQGGGSGGALAGFGGNRSGGHRHAPFQALKEGAEAAAVRQREALLNRLGDPDGDVSDDDYGGSGGAGGGRVLPLGQSSGSSRPFEAIEPRDQLRRLAKAFEAFANHRRKVSHNPPRPCLNPPRGMLL
jgi:hypothetical protein